MFSSFLIITGINLFLLAMIIVIAANNSSISYKQRYYFVTTTVIVGVICILELISFLVDKAGEKWRLMNFLSNYLGFALTPLVPYFIGNAIMPFKKSRLYLFPWVIYAVWLFISAFTPNGVFSVSKENVYSRGLGFVVFLIFYGFSIILLVVMNFKISLKYQKRNTFLLWMNVVFIFSGTSVQVLFPDIHVSWSCVIVGLLFYYIYNDELFQQLDFQTELLNYNSFLRAISLDRNDLILIVVEIDNYSKLKLNFTRSQTDNILVAVSKKLKSFYKKYGDCFRIGTEEFGIIVHDLSLDVDSLNQAFFMEVIKENYNIKEMPLVSIGYARMEKGDDLNQVLSQADRSKRKFIQNRINYIYN